MATTFEGIAEFDNVRPLILDCWMLYLHKHFKNKDPQVQLKYFPTWSNSKEVRKLFITRRAKYIFINIKKHPLLYPKINNIKFKLIVTV